MQVLENEILGHVLRPLGEKAIALSNQLTDGEAEDLRIALANFLVSEAKDKQNELIEAAVEQVEVDRKFKSILYRDDDGSGKTNKIISFTFRDALAETALPLFGLSLALYSGKWGVASLPYAAGILKTLWSKLVVLKRPADADAIDVLEALLQLRAGNVIIGTDKNPTTKEIKTNCGLTEDAVLRAIMKLNSLAVIEVSEWAGQSEDMQNALNRWRVKL